MEVANEADYLAAAKKNPLSRTPAEQALVERGIAAGKQSVKNAAHATEERIKTYGK